MSCEFKVGSCIHFPRGLEPAGQLPVVVQSDADGQTSLSPGMYLNLMTIYLLFRLVLNHQLLNVMNYDDPRSISPVVCNDAEDLLFEECERNN